MSNEKRKILDMLAEGKITADEAERLLAAVDEPQETAVEKTEADTGGKEKAKGKTPKYLRVVVLSEDGCGSGKPEKVNIKVPLAILRTGVKLAALLPNQAQEKIDEALHEKGMDLNISELDAATMDEFINALSDMSIDVDGGRETVKLYCE